MSSGATALASPVAGLDQESCEMAIRTEQTGMVLASRLRQAAGTR
jgi:hypothetical protein